MRFQEMVDALVTDAEPRHAIDQLLVIKRSEHGKPQPAINAFIDSQLPRLEGRM